MLLPIQINIFKILIIIAFIFLSFFTAMYPKSSFHDVILNFLLISILYTIYFNLSRFHLNVKIILNMTVIQYDFSK